MTTKAQQEKNEEPKPMEGLAKGRVVYFHPGARLKDNSLMSEAATVAHVLDPVTGRCNLGVLNTEGEHRAEHDIPYSTEPAAGTWSWPPKK